jgi:large subunit ribosomal protein L31
MAKKGLHPELFLSKIYCDGKLILTIPSTKKELYVDIWAGNHPFYTNSQRIMDTEGRIAKFMQRFNYKILKQE